MTSRPAPRALAAVLAAAGMLAACSGANTVPQTGALAAPSDLRAAAADGTLALSVRVPKPPPQALRRHYVSPASAGLAYAIAGSKRLASVASLQPNAPGCIAGATATTCTIAVNGLPACSGTAACYTIAIATYDAVACAAGRCTIPKTAKKLSAIAGLPFAIAASKRTTLKVSPNGIPASATLVAAAGTGLVPTGAKRFAVSKCLKTQDVNVYGVDADGYLITGAGAPQLSLSSDDTSVVSVRATPAPASPNRFTLGGPFAVATPAPSAIPSPGTVLHLTAVAKALGSGKAVSSIATLTVNHDVCGVATRFVVSPAVQAYDIVPGPDGNLWFTNYSGATVGRITTSGQITQYPLTPGYHESRAIAVGSDGALWFSEYATSPFGPNVGRMTTAGVVTANVGAAVDDQGVAYLAPTGDVWFTNIAGGMWAVSPNGTASAIGSGMSGAGVGFANAANGNVWFTAGGYGQSSVGQVDASGNVLKTYQLLDAKDSAEKLGVVDGSGNFWFVASDGDDANHRLSAVYVLAPNGTMSRYVACCNFNYMTIGPDGAAWLTSEGSTIARVSPTGAVSYPYRAPQGGILDSITVGPDGNLWFTEQTQSAIDRLQ